MSIRSTTNDQPNRLIKIHIAARNSFYKHRFLGFYRDYVPPSGQYEHDTHSCKCMLDMGTVCMSPNIFVEKIKFKYMEKL